MCVGSDASQTSVSQARSGRNLRMTERSGKQDTYTRSAVDRENRLDSSL